MSLNFFLRGGWEEVDCGELGIMRSEYSGTEAQLLAYINSIFFLLLHLC